MWPHRLKRTYLKPGYLKRAYLDRLAARRGPREAPFPDLPVASRVADGELLRVTDGSVAGAVEFRSDLILTGWIDLRFETTLIVTVSGGAVRQHIEFVPRPDLEGVRSQPARGFFCVLQAKLGAGDEVTVEVAGRAAATFVQPGPVRARHTAADPVAVHLDEPQGVIARRHLHFSGWIKLPAATASIVFCVDGQPQNASFHSRWDAVQQLGSPRVIGFEFDHEVGAAGDLAFSCTVDGHEVHRVTIEARTPVGPRPDVPLTLFMHVPKTAGTSLANAFRRLPALETCWLYPSPRLTLAEQVAAIGDRVDDLDLIGGHFTYGLHRSFARECRYITFFREPGELLFSYFNYMKHVVRDPAWTNIGYAEAIAGRLDPHLDNPLTRYLSEASPSERVNAKDAERATENMRRHFVVVGLLSRMDDSLRCLSDRLGLQLDVRYENQTPASDHRDAVTEDLAALLKPYTTYDDDIYRRAQDML